MFIPHYVSCVMCHIPHVMCHLSHVTCHVSCHLSHDKIFCSSFIFFLKENWTRWWSSSVKGLLSMGLTPFSYSRVKSMNEGSWVWGVLVDDPVAGSSLCWVMASLGPISPLGHQGRDKTTSRYLTLSVIFHKMKSHIFPLEIADVLMGSH